MKTEKKRQVTQQVNQTHPECLQGKAAQLWPRSTANIKQSFVSGRDL